MEVITPSVIDPAEMDVGLPTTADPGWEPLLYLDDAVARGLVQTRERIGGTWAEMEQAVESLGALLVAAGWRFDGVKREMSIGGGESVVGMFSRGSLSAELEYYEEGTLCVYEPSDSAPPDEDDPAVTWVGDPDQAAMRDLFTRLGMLAPPAASEEAAHGGVQPC